MSDSGEGFEQSSLRDLPGDDFGIAYDARLPPLGSLSEGLRILSETWRRPAIHWRSTFPESRPRIRNRHRRQPAKDSCRGKGGWILEGGDRAAKKLGEEKFKIPFRRRIPARIRIERSSCIFPADEIGKR